MAWAWGIHPYFPTGAESVPQGIGKDEGKRRDGSGHLGDQSPSLSLGHSREGDSEVLQGVWGVQTM